MLTTQYNKIQRLLNEEVHKVSGLEEQLQGDRKHLDVDWTMEGTVHLQDLEVDADQNMAVYLLEPHGWMDDLAMGGTSGIGESSLVAVFKNGESKRSENFHYRHSSNPQLDDYGNRFESIESYSVEGNTVKIKVKSQTNGEREFEFSFQKEASKEGYQWGGKS